MPGKENRYRRFQDQILEEEAGDKDYLLQKAKVLEALV